MTASDWSIVFYTDARGDELVRAFLHFLDLRTQARFDWSIEQLRLRNVHAREPLVKHLDGRIWELRREIAVAQRRLTEFLSREGGDNR